MDVRTYDHDLGVVDVALELAREGKPFLTEREMRSADGGVEPREWRFSVPLRGYGPDAWTPRRHLPDLGLRNRSVAGTWR